MMALETVVYSMSKYKFFSDTLKKPHKNTDYPS